MIKALLLILSLCLCSYSAEWELVLEQDSIRVYSKGKNDSKLKAFRAEGIVHANIEKVLYTILDSHRRPQWNPKMDTVFYTKRVDSLSYHFAEWYKTPWPAKDREFLLLGTIISKTKNDITLLARSDHSLNNASEKHLTATVHSLELNLKSLDNNSTLLTFKFDGDLGGWLPTWLINLIQKKWPLRFIQGLRSYSNNDVPQDCNICNETIQALKNMNRL